MTENCENCGKPLVGRDPRTKYCDAKCRVQAMRARNRPAPAEPVADPDAIDQLKRQHALAMAELKRQHAKELAKAEIAPLQVDVTEHPEFKRQLKNHKAKLTREHNAQVIHEARAMAEDKAIQATRYGIFTAAEMKLLKMALHPDANLSDTKKTEAFRIWSNVKIPVKK